MKAGYKPVEIAQLLSRHNSSISRELSRSLVDRHHTTRGFQCHLGLEIRTVNLALLTLCNAIARQGQ